MPVLVKGSGGGSGAGYKYQLGNVKDLKYTYTRTQLNITWSDPDNILLNGEILSEWFGTAIVCKQGSKPISIEDGEIIYITNQKDKHKTNPYVVTTGGEGYYYGVFPFTRDYVVNVLEGNILYWQFPSLEEMSWEEIDSVVGEGQHTNYWSVGDKKTVVLSGEIDGTFEVQIADFNFYDLSDGSGKAGIVFTFTKNVIDDAHVYNGQVYNYMRTSPATGTYGQEEVEIDSKTQYNMLGLEIEKIRNSLPSELRNVIKLVNAKCSQGTTGLVVGGGSTGSYGPRPNAVINCENSDIFPPSYAEVTNGKTFTRRLHNHYPSSMGIGYSMETVNEGSPLELFKYDTLDDLKGTPLDKGGVGFLRTIYSTYSGYDPGYIYMKTFELNSENKVTTKDNSLNYRLYEGIECTGTGATAGLCPLFCV